MTLALLLAQAQGAVDATPGLLATVAPWGVLTAALSLFGLMWRSTISAHQQRADDWRQAHQLERAAHDQTRAQLLRVLAPLSERAS